MRYCLMALACLGVSFSNAVAQTQPVDPALDLSRVPPQALARMQPELRAADASSRNFLPADVPPFTASGPITAGGDLSVIPRRHARAGILEAPLVGRDGALLEAGTPVFRWHVPSTDSTTVLAFWCGVSNAAAHCFDDAATYTGAGPVPFAPANVADRVAFAPGASAPAVGDVEWAQSGLPVLEWIYVFEGWERRRANVSRGLRINGQVYGRRETYHDRRNQDATPMALQNGGRVIARPGPDARSATIEITTPEAPYAPKELEVWTRAIVTFLGRPQQ